jgi:Mycoplasma protein of unknown function, DUF285
MIGGCSSFNLDISDWNMVNAINQGFMFDGCSSFNWDVSSGNVANATCFARMFDGCSSFNLDNWNAANATNLMQNVL